MRYAHGHSCTRIHTAIVYTPEVARLLTSLVVLAVAGGCTGVIGKLGGDQSGGAGLGGDGGPGTNPADPRLDARVWRLTPAQYNGEVQRAFPGAPQVDLPVGGSEYGITNIASSARIDSGHATQYSEVARTIGTWVASQGAAAARCQTFGTTQCVDTFLGWFPAAAYRRP